jgi:hypothetical protein
MDGDVEAHLIALSCGEPPEVFSKRSLRENPKSGKNSETIKAQG